MAKEYGLDDWYAYIAHDGRTAPETSYDHFLTNFFAKSCSYAWLLPEHRSIYEPRSCAFCTSSVYVGIPINVHMFTLPHLPVCEVCLTRCCHHSNEKSVLHVRYHPAHLWRKEGEIVNYYSAILQLSVVVKGVGTATMMKMVYHGKLYSHIQFKHGDKFVFPNTPPALIKSAAKRG